MTPLMWEAVLVIAAKFGFEVALDILKAVRGSTTIDDAIAALSAASTKVAQQYLDEAKTQTTALKK